MITYTKGDAIDLFLQSDSGSFAHGCNCYCTMGAGIAKQVKQRLPELCEVDKKTIVGSRGKLGTFTSTTIDDKRAYNLYTQYGYGTSKKHFDMFAFVVAFSSMLDDMVKRNITTVIIPKIGTGLAGGNWKEVEGVINNILDKKNLTEIVVKVVEYDIHNI